MQEFSKSNFTNARNALLLANKLKNWYGVTAEVKHFELHSSITVSDLEFTVSSSKLFDKQNGSFRLAYKGKAIECTQMYKLVQNLKA